MTKQDIIKKPDEKQAPHKTIAAALAAAQMDMGRALKSATNPHFKSKYADLGAVVEACLPALNKHGIAVIQPMTDGEGGRAVVTTFIHESGETLSCPIPLIVAKNDMQGLGSAMTYARRYGLMALAGIAPEDDDGNAAVKAAPRTATADQQATLRATAERAGVPEATICKAYSAASFRAFMADDFDSAMRRLEKTIEANAPKPSDSVAADEIPY